MSYVDIFFIIFRYSIIVLLIIKIHSNSKKIEKLTITTEILLDNNYKIKGTEAALFG